MITKEATLLIRQAKLDRQRMVRAFFAALFSGTTKASAQA